MSNKSKFTGKIPILEMESYSIKFDGRVLERGFWLYVIDIFTPEGRRLYVGRTGDSSSCNAGSPFSRIGQHLDCRANAKGNALARNLRAVGIIFFSSRRRHTRFDCDWSSDVCSSDLSGPA